MRVILAIFTDRFETFTSLKPFFEKYPEFKVHKHPIYTALSRNKESYEHEICTLTRLNVQKSLRP